MQDSTRASSLQHSTSFQCTPFGAHCPSQAVPCCFAGPEPPCASSCHTPLGKFSRVGHEVVCHWHSQFPESSSLAVGPLAQKSGHSVSQNSDASPCSVEVEPDEAVTKFGFAVHPFHADASFKVLTAVRLQSQDLFDLNTFQNEQHALRLQRAEQLRARSLSQIRAVADPVLRAYLREVHDHDSPVLGTSSH